MYSYRNANEIWSGGEGSRRMEGSGSLDRSIASEFLLFQVERLCHLIIRQWLKAGGCFHPMVLLAQQRRWGLRLPMKLICYLDGFGCQIVGRS